MISAFSFSRLNLAAADAPPAIPPMIMTRMISSLYLRSFNPLKQLHSDYSSSPAR
jgi:hypothetical protein